MGKYRILYVVQKMGVGGEEVMVLDHLLHLDRNIFQPYLAVITNQGELLSKIPADIGYFYIEDNRNDINNFIIRQYSRIKGLLRIIKSVKPHIVFTVLFDSSLFTRIIRRICPHKFIFIAREPHNKFRDFKESYSLKNIVRTRLIRFAFSGADVIVTVSKGSMKEISARYKIPIGKFKVIYNSVDVNRIIAQAALPSNSFSLQHPAVLSLGRLIYRKGFQNLIQAMTLLPKTHLYLIGKGEYEASLLALTNEAGLNDRVHFLGFLDNPYNIVRQTDVFVFPSLWEGFGNVIIEAMACEVPVVATRCPHGPEEIITDGVNGVLAPVNGAGFLATAIASVLEDDFWRKRLVESGRRRAKDFRVEKQVKEYEKFFLELINQKPSPVPPSGGKSFANASGY
jgi:glycosyltransferase involved in cell wall biosynthesis